MGTECYVYYTDAAAVTAILNYHDTITVTDWSATVKFGFCRLNRRKIVACSFRHKLQFEVLDYSLENGCALPCLVEIAEYTRS